MSRHVSLQGLRSHNDRALRDWTIAVADGWDKSYIKATFEAGAEAADTIRVTISVCNRKNARVTGAFVLRVIVGTTDDAVPGGTQTVATVTGTNILNITANEVADILTDENGQVVLDITVAGAGTRYVSVVHGSEAFISQAVVWT